MLCKKFPQRPPLGAHHVKARHPITASDGYPPRLHPMDEMNSACHIFSNDRSRSIKTIFLQLSKTIFNIILSEIIPIHSNTSLMMKIPW